MTCKFRKLYKLSSSDMKGLNMTPSGGDTETGRVIYKSIEERHSQ